MEDGSFGGRADTAEELAIEFHKLVVQVGLDSSLWVQSQRHWCFSLPRELDLGGSQDGPERCDAWVAIHHDTAARRVDVLLKSVDHCARGFVAEEKTPLSVLGYDALHLHGIELGVVASKQVCNFSKRWRHFARFRFDRDDLIKGWNEKMPICHLPTLIHNCACDACEQDPALQQYRSALCRVWLEGHISLENLSRDVENQRESETILLSAHNKSFDLNPLGVDPLGKQILGTRPARFRDGTLSQILCCGFFNIRQVRAVDVGLTGDSDFRTIFDVFV